MNPLQFEIDLEKKKAICSLSLDVQRHFLDPPPLEWGLFLI